MNIVSFSGGKDSTAMLLMMLEKGIPIDRVICVDTTKEFPAMYPHIEKIQKMIEPLKIEIVKIDFDYWFSDHVIQGGKFQGEKGRSWPDWRVRWCTGLKSQAISHLKHNVVYNPRIEKYYNGNEEDIIEFHGIAFDEQERIGKNKLNKRKCEIKYPLVDWGITEKQALEYCYVKGFDWDGLYEKFHRVSCWCCPLSRIGELKVLYNDFPELWKELQEMDKKTFRKFRNDYSVAELTERFAKEG